ncbi:hypothetical protein LLE49_02935 [Alicyclobacillus tolerans]|uniref:hypothetical protein n=1 Tax=Alicyclobacillus tolerans TaxID=90970 RepID=UPI001F21657B|nr:hypothetical protein [Alicyclobacillus tolerans]MCF8563695.1 hypothetical protein [Alicyclobacillus tolerans]
MTEESKTTPRHSGKELPWPELPSAWQHRVSLKWLTLESLRIVHQRLETQGKALNVALLTTSGLVHGDLAQIADTYEESLNSPTHADIASAVVHLRTDLWRTYEKQDPELQPTDSGAIVHLRNATVHIGSETVHFAELALFASDIIGFTLTETAILQ